MKTKNETQGRNLRAGGIASRGGFPAAIEDRGLYILVFSLKSPCMIGPGRLGKREFLQGRYLYIGRAKKGLKSRLQRHIRKEKKLFWHIDYLLPHACFEKIWLRPGFFEECPTASKILSASRNAFLPVPGFGSSDCRCPGHLIQVPEEGGNWREVVEDMNFIKAEVHEHKI